MNIRLNTKKEARLTGSFLSITNLKQVSFNEQIN